MQKRFLVSVLLITAISASAQVAQEVTPVVPIIVKGPLTPPTPAQAKDQLLWYKGKKMDDSTLITQHGTLVRWSRPRDLVIVQPKKDPFAKMVTELQRTELVKEKLYDRIAEKRNVLTLYPDIKNTLAELDSINNRYSVLLKNTITLPPAISPTTAVTSSRRGGGVAAVSAKFVLKMPGVPTHVKQAHDALMQQKKNYPSIEFPAPPEQHADLCFVCDGIAQNQYGIDAFKWHNEFTKYEADLVRRSLSITKTLETLELHSDPEAVQIEADLETVKEFAFARMKNKVDLLIRRYGKDFKRLHSVITEAVSLARQMQLLGIVEEGSSDDPMTRLAGLLEGFEDYLEQQMDARNYNLVLNIAFAISVERQRQLLGASDSNGLSGIWDKITAFNRFKMDLQVQYKAKSEDGSQSNLTATNLNPVYVTFGKQDCKFTIYGVENTSEGIAWFAYYRGGYEIPLLVTNGSGTEVINRDDGTSYTITHDLSGLNLKFDAPIGSVSFCEDGNQDSLQFEPALQPHGPKDKRHSYMHSFMTEMVNDGYPEGLPEEIEQIQDELQELSLKAKDKETERFKKPLFQELEQQYAEERRRKQLHLRETQYEERENPSTVVFDARNGEAEIIDAKTAIVYDGIKYSGREDKATLTIMVKIVHDPLPYKDKKPSKQ